MLVETYDFRPVRIEELVREAPNAVSVRLSTVMDYHFLAGQHAIVRVTLPDGTKLVRQYSYASAPSSGEIWLTIVQEPQGEVSTWFTGTAQVGTIIEISPPYNGPLVQKTPRGKLCMIAGGSGIVPLMSHLRQLRLSKAETNIAVLYSTRSNERCFLEELSPLANEHITIRLTDNEPRFSPEEILAAIDGTEEVFICGSRPFVIAMRKLSEQKLPQKAIHCEAFSL